jgi:competence protein ComEA
MLERMGEWGKRWKSLPRWKQGALVLLVLFLAAAGFFLLRPPGERKVEVIGTVPAEEEGRPTEIVVYVAGAVKSPGIQRLPAGSRMADALERAGDPLPEADLEGLNLAQKLEDGQRVYVPRRGQMPAGTASSGKVNVNTAPASELEKLPGIGPTLAARIVEYRERNGPFRRVEDLKKVKGIGESKLRELRDRVEV